MAKDRDSESWSWLRLAPASISFLKLIFRVIGKFKRLFIKAECINSGLREIPARKSISAIQSLSDTKYRLQKYWKTIDAESTSSQKYLYNNSYPTNT